ncbi:MAG: SH3 domain-containing protein, partial [Myxococcota bacterium]|nr:SH3 domain-containing protein [Myxococcota bacterium]
KEIPPLAFSFFDPALGTYQTVRSQPIALSVSGAASVVGAQDVVTAQDSEPTEAKPAKASKRTDKAAPVSLLGVELGLSEPSQTLSRPVQLQDLMVPVAILHALPLLFLAFLAYRRRTDGSRGEEQRQKQALEALRAALREARSSAAASTQLANALREWAKLSELSAAAEGVLQQLETVAYDPKLKAQPLPAALLDEIEALSQRKPARGGKAALLLLLCALGASVLWPQSAQAQTVDAAREAYQQALSLEERGERTVAFSRAAALFAELVEAHPDSPELLVDWGNAALGAQDMGSAVLAYRRALLLDPHQARAAKNLAFVRQTLPDELPKPKAESGAFDALFFVNHFLAAPWRALLASLLFATAVLMLAPWRREKLKRALRFAAVLPALLWLWLGASVLVEEDQQSAAVITTEGLSLRSADSVGAAAALQTPLSAGLEVELLEQRGDWSRVRLADGAEGWVQSSAVRRVQD